MTERAERVADDGVEAIVVEFEGFADVELAFESLARERSGIELLNVRTHGNRLRASVLVPLGKLQHFERIVADYLAQKKGKNDRPLDHRRLVDTIASIRFGTLRALWTDNEAFPADEAREFWWEVWLQVRRDRGALLASFRQLADEIGARVSPGVVSFPERTVVQIYASPQQLKRSLAFLSYVAELRRAKETADFFDSLPLAEQVAWLQDLLARTTFARPASASIPHICLLDTGANNGHALIGPALADSDLHTLDPAWGTNDAAGHGTQMAGLALFGDLTAPLSDRQQVRIAHRLESVKVLTRDGANQGDARHHAYLTIEAVSRPEIARPTRRRLFAMALSARDNRDRGRPSAWSAAIDALAADADGEGAKPRLFVICAGNTDPGGWSDYPASNSTDTIHDPGQSWNALTVGSATELIRITEPDTEEYEPVADTGGLSPFSTTSGTWQNEWPLKPDVLMEGGNAARDSLATMTMTSLSMLTTHHRPLERSFTPFCETSSSTALASRLAAQLMDAYPSLRPETIRGLIVHSASWTDEMRRMYLPAKGPIKKDDYRVLIRHCGFGMPDLERAQWSASNALSLIVEERLTPFERKESATPKLREMHLHRLPWPSDELEALGDSPVEMRVTLSYFVEPNPSARGGARYSYQSHGLRFDVRRADETVDAFRSRINRAARAEEEGRTAGGDDPDWIVGKQLRHRGSVHSDIWTGTAADLASRGVVGVYPAMGWWKTRAALQQFDRTAPYSLIVSIHAPTVEVDLYAAVENKIAIETRIEI